MTFSSTWDLPDLGVEPLSPVSPASAGRFFTVESPEKPYLPIQLKLNVRFPDSKSTTFGFFFIFPLLGCRNLLGHNNRPGEEFLVSICSPVTFGQLASGTLRRPLTFSVTYHAIVCFGDLFTSSS